MKWLKYLLWALFAGVVFYYLIILGGPIRNLIELRGCTVTYTHYLTDHAFNKCVGDCPTNAMILTNARREVANCLCENAPQNKLEARELMELIQADAMLRSTFDYFQSQQGVSLNSVQAICDHRVALFAPLTPGHTPQPLD